MGIGVVSAAWREERGRESQSFVFQTVLDSEPPRLRDSGAHGQKPPPKSGALLTTGATRRSLRLSRTSWSVQGDTGDGRSLVNAAK